MTDWIEWAGGECPVAPETQVEVRLRDGHTWMGKAADADWDYDEPFDYRIVEPDAKPEPVAAPVPVDAWTYLAGQALPELMRNPDAQPYWLASRAADVADAFLAERAKRGIV